MVGLAEACSSSSSASACGSETGHFVTDNPGVAEISGLPIICYFADSTSGSPSGQNGWPTSSHLRVVRTVYRQVGQVSLSMRVPAVLPGPPPAASPGLGPHGDTGQVLRRAARA